MSNNKIVDIKERELSKDDQILYSTTHGNMQVGRIIEITEAGEVKVIGKGNKRELVIIDPSRQIYLLTRGYYLKNKKRAA
jgi:hypothetical protein